ncbi:hypothetical protein QCA50_019342 [Cerrena zonata]|uniref:Metalloendopeptidase n=1 Tax=Cerrena zonata TaxID=2478898 RepID=A0AAW0FB09_9APHY
MSSSTIAYACGCALNSCLSTHEFRCILHDIGHMLGFVHEHQSPSRVTQVTYNDQATVLYYADIWSPLKVERSVLRIHAEERLAAYSPFDDISIMLYEIPPSTNDEGRHFPRPTTLSPIDKAFATLMYPPNPSANLDVLKNCLTLAGVPPPSQREILEVREPHQFRAKFTQWNRNARVAYRVRNHSA